MKKILLQTLNKEDCIVFILVLALISTTIIFSLMILTIEETEKNSYVEPVFIPKTINKIEEIFGVGSFYDYTLKSGWSSVGHFVCATRDFERYSMIKVTNIDNGKVVICKKTDYGPDESIHPDRIIDLSSTAFKELAPLSVGLINVKIEKL